jgi:hypothetical protein
VGGDVGGAFAQAGDLVDVLEAVEFAFEAGEGVEGCGVGVAALFEEVGAGVEGHAAEAGRGAGGIVVRGARRRRCGRVRGGWRRRSRWRCGGVFGAEHGLGVAGEFVEALGGEADAEVVAGDLFELVGLVEDDGGGFGEDAGVGGSGGLLLDGGRRRRGGG